MNEFIKSYKKYLIILIIGIIIFLAPDFLKAQDTTNTGEKQFIEIMKTAKGVGELKIMSGKTKEGEVSGIVIVAQGADSPEIKKQITDAAVAAFNVQSHKVQIFSYKQEVE